jgi:phosphatidylinositol alpha-mannosyltransferase
VLWQATVPVVAQFSTYRSEGHRWYPKFRRFFERLMSRVHVRLAVSDAARRTVADHFPGDYEVVPCAIDVARFAAPAPRPPAMPADRPYVLYVGRLEPRKGVDRLVDAMTRVRERVRNAHLVIIGGGPDREAIETRAQDRRVPVLFAGRVSDEDLPAYYQAADVVCSPALADESFGIVLLEAMAAGRPIVASNIAGYAELLEPAGCALLAPPGDVETLANAICTLLQDTQLARTFGRRGADAAKKYDWDVVSRRLVGIYELCLDKLAVER